MTFRAIFGAAVAGILAASAVPASPPLEASRPEARPGTAMVVLASAAGQRALPTVLRPTPRPETLAPGPDLRPVASNPGFDTWVRNFRPRALRAGIRPDVFDAAFRGVQYNPEVIRKDRNQSEFVKPIWEYLDRAVSDKRLKNGRKALRQNRRTLDRIEAHFGVEKEVVAAIWGMESAYGEFRGDLPLIGSLATLAYDGRRGRFFESQLIAALKILQNGDITPRRMTGSWAGAMGHTQFIPTSYQALAVDFTGDGKRDIWSDDPTDALASTAAYLARYGWRKGMPWGVEVQLPRDFDFSSARRSNTAMPSTWAKRGVLGMDGKPVPDYGSASVLLPAGARGAAFLIFANFRVIERYNAADAYVIGVGHLSDRLRGKGPIRASWPIGDRDLTYAERVELQRRLTARGFNTGGVDGKIGPNSMAAIKRFQQSLGLPQDGYASLSLLKRLR